MYVSKPITRQHKIRWNRYYSNFGRGTFYLQLPCMDSPFSLSSFDNNTCRYLLWQIICFFQASLAHTTQYGHIILHLSFTRELLPIFLWCHVLLSLCSWSAVGICASLYLHHPSSFCSLLLLRSHAVLSLRHTAQHNAADSNLCALLCGIWCPTRRPKDDRRRRRSRAGIRWKFKRNTLKAARKTWHWSFQCSGW
jgi:hypothetical protein